MNYIPSSLQICCSIFSGFVSFTGNFWFARHFENFSLVSSEGDFPTFQGIYPFDDSLIFLLTSSDFKAAFVASPIFLLCSSDNFPPFFASLIFLLVSSECFLSLKTTLICSYIPYNINNLLTACFYII